MLKMKVWPHAVLKLADLVKLYMHCSTGTALGKATKSAVEWEWGKGQGGLAILNAPPPPNVGASKGIITVSEFLIHIPAISATIFKLMHKLLQKFRLCFTDVKTTTGICMHVYVYMYMLPK